MILSHIRSPGCKNDNVWKGSEKRLREPETLAIENEVERCRSTEIREPRKGQSLHKVPLVALGRARRWQQHSQAGSKTSNDKKLLGPHSSEFIHSGRQANKLAGFV